jgi:hypothetical protein
MEWDGIVFDSDGRAVIEGASSGFVSDARVSWETDAEDVIHNHPIF